MTQRVSESAFVKQSRNPSAIGRDGRSRLDVAASRGMAMLTARGRRGDGINSVLRDCMVRGLNGTDRVSSSKLLRIRQMADKIGQREWS